MVHLHPSDIVTQNRERERRLDLLRTGLLSDWTIVTSVGTYKLHSVFLTTRCEYLYRLVTTQMGDKTPNTCFELRLPDPLLSTDGPWEENDLAMFWRELYRMDDEHNTSSCFNRRFDLNEMKVMFRLHRLADYLRCEALVKSIERDVLGNGLSHWTSWLDIQNSADPSAELVPLVQAWFDACSAAPESRCRLLNGLRFWLSTLVASFYANPKNARIEWLLALDNHGEHAFRAQNPMAAVLIDPATQLTVLCAACMRSDTVHLADSRWVLAQDGGVQYLVHAQTNAQATLIDLVHWDMSLEKLEVGLGLSADPALTDVSATAYAWRPSNRHRVDSKYHHGRCMNCRFITSALHVWLLRTHDASNRLGVQEDKMEMA